MSVHKYKNDSTWYVKYKRKTYRGFNTKKEAQLFESQLMLNENEINNNSIRFEEVAEDFLKSKKIKVTYGTHQQYENIYYRIIKPNFDVRKRIEKITRNECRDFYEWLYSTDFATSNKNKILNFFKAIFKHSRRHFEANNNPTEALEKYRETYRERQQKREKQFNVWSVEEFSRFVKEVDNKTYQLFFIVLYFTGMRKGEAMALKWTDYSNGELDINKNVTTKTECIGYELKDPKNVFSNRRVSVGENVEILLNEYKKEEMKISGFNEDWFMFGRIKPISTTNLDRYKKYAIEKSGVKNIRIHDLRHSHASNLFALGIDYITISKRLGHNNPMTTLNVYAHLIDTKNILVDSYINKSSHKCLK